MLTILLSGAKNEAYNIAAENSDIRLKDLATMIAELGGTKVIKEIPDEIEASGYSKATKARLNGEKLQDLGWRPQYDIRRGLERTINVLKQINSRI
jgi:nucleoside-diphosphate-sugar epimerase